MTTKRETIDLTPTWAGLMPTLIAILRDGNLKGQKLVEQELMKLAQEMDEINEQRRAARQKAEQEAEEIFAEDFEASREELEPEPAVVIAWRDLRMLPICYELPEGRILLSDEQTGVESTGSKTLDGFDMEREIFEITGERGRGIRIDSLSPEQRKTLRHRIKAAIERRQS